MRRIAALSFLPLLIALCVGIVAVYKDAMFYPWFVSETQITVPPAQDGASSAMTTSVSLSFLGHGIKSQQQCQRQLVAMNNVLRTNCPSCAVLEIQCLNPLDAERRGYLSNEPIEHPVVTYAAGVVIYKSDRPEVAVTTCEQSVELAGANALQMRCLPSNTPKPSKGLIREWESLPVFAGWLGAIGLLTTWLGCYFLIRYEHLHGHFSHDHVSGGPQKAHSKPTPRIGGVTIFFALMVIGMLLQTMGHRFGTQEFGLLLFAALPAFLVGLAEDVTKRVGVLPRLVVTMFAALAGAWLLNAVVTRVDVAWIDFLFTWSPLALVFTLIAVGGVANAVNIIDGYNGLAGGSAFIAALALGGVAWQVGDPLVMCGALVMAGVLMGFLAWNWPGGHIFLGDGGAYLVGFWIAELAVLLVARNPSVSAWFPLAILIYPIFETLFSIVRRRTLGLSPGAPDAAHLHQLIHRWLASRTHHEPVVAAKLSPEERTRLNGQVARYVWIPNLILALAAVSVYANQLLLVCLAALFCVGYVLAYRRLIHPSK